MSSEIKKTKKTKFAPLTAERTFPELGFFFPEGTPPTFTLRSLTKEELSQVEEAAIRGRDRASALEAKFDDNGKKELVTLRKRLGIPGDGFSENYLKCLELVILGTVTPKLDHETALRLVMTFPFTFLSLSCIILDLSVSRTISQR
jgi:hypothetical protein